MNNLLEQFFGNRALVAAIAAWFAAQIIKIIICSAQERKLDLSLLIASGGMPSSHSSTVCALSTVIFRTCGLSSPEFAIALVFSFIVMYDAAGVRRQAGEHAKLLNKLVEDIYNGNTEYLEENLKELIGHTPFQVSVGAVLGVVTGAVFPI